MTTEELLEKANTLIENRKPIPLYLIPELVVEIERFQRSAAGWEEDAKRCAKSADYWCKECLKLREAKHNCPQGIKCPYLQKELDEKDAKYENLKSAWREMFASKQLVLDDLRKTKDRLNYSELLRQAQNNQIEGQARNYQKLDRYVKALELELEFLKTYSRMFWHENSWEGNCLLDCDAVARAVLADIKSRHL